MPAFFNNPCHTPGNTQKNLLRTGIKTIQENKLRARSGCSTTAIKGWTDSGGERMRLPCAAITKSRPLLEHIFVRSICFGAESFHTDAQGLQKRFESYIRGHKENRRSPCKYGLIATLQSRRHKIHFRPIGIRLARMPLTQNVTGIDTE
jgi:hypothetical protein